MSLKIYTGQIRYAFDKTIPNTLDITIKSGSELGKVFAPTWKLVTGYKDGSISPDVYTNAYHYLLNSRYRQDKGPWRELLSMDSVILCCYCPEVKFDDLHKYISLVKNPSLKLDGFCHRYVLAYILTLLDAEYCGEYRKEKAL